MSHKYIIRKFSFVLDKSLMKFTNQTHGDILLPEKSKMDYKGHNNQNLKIDNLKTKQKLQTKRKIFCNRQCQL